MVPPLSPPIGTFVTPNVPDVATTVSTLLLSPHTVTEWYAEIEKHAILPSYHYECATLSYLATFSVGSGRWAVAAVQWSVRKDRLPYNSATKLFMSSKKWRRNL